MYDGSFRVLYCFSMSRDGLFDASPILPTNCMILYLAIKSIFFSLIARPTHSTVAASHLGTIASISWTVRFNPSFRLISRAQLYIE